MDIEEHVSMATYLVTLSSWLLLVMLSNVLAIKEEACIREGGNEIMEQKRRNENQKHLESRTTPTL